VPEFIVTSPDGKKYKVNGPEGSTQADAIAYVQGGNAPEDSFLSRIGEDLSARGDKFDDISNAYQSGQQGLARSTGQALLNTVVGGVNDVVGEGISTGAGALNDLSGGMLGQAGSGALSLMGRLPSIGGGTIGERLPSELANIGQQYGQFAEANPAIARDLDAAGNALGLLTAGIPATRAVRAGVEAAPEAIAGARTAVSNIPRPSISVNGMAPSIDPVKLPVIDLAKKHNIQVGLSDLTDNETYKRLISQGEALPFSQGSRNAADQQKSFNRAVSRTFTEEADALTPEIMDKARKSLGNDFQAFTKDKTFEITPAYLTKLDEINNAVSRGDYGKDAQSFYDTYKGDVDKVSSDMSLIKGDQLDRLRRQFSKTARTSPDEGLAKLASDFEDGIVELISDSDPTISKAISDAKYRYKNYKTVQGLTIKDQVSGNVSPTQLTQRVVSSFGPDAVATGRAGDLGEIARVGQTMRKLNDSGTAKNTIAQNVLNANLSAIPFGALVNPVIPAIQAAATGGAWLANRGLQSRDINPEVLKKAIAKQLSKPVQVQRIQKKTP